MCEALRELMKEEIQEEIQEERKKAADIALIAAIKNQMKKLGWDATRTMENMGISVEDQRRYIAKL